MRYVEYARTPHQRSGVMVPISALPDLYARDDSGYCTHYAFDELAASAIRAQGNSQGLGRFSVYSDRLWIDLDAPSSDPAAVEATKAYTREIARQLKQRNLAFSVWFSGSKGYHICIKIEPMQGRDVPYSQAEFVREDLKLSCDFSLYQHGRLLSNPGRLHPKTGIKKHKIMESSGQLLTIPLLVAPERPSVDTESLTDVDLAKLSILRLDSLVSYAHLVKPGMRHQTLWSTAMSLLAAGMTRDVVFGLLCWSNKFLSDPKPVDEIARAVDQAVHQSR